jgi:tellurite resistance protein TerC
MEDNLIDHPGIIIGFTVAVIFMLLLDLGIFNKKNHVISSKEAAIWSIVWIGLSMIFSIFIYIVTAEASGLEKFSQYQAAYWIEKALSVDNLFVFILVFGYFTFLGYHWCACHARSIHFCRSRIDQSYLLTRDESFWSKC